VAEDHQTTKDRLLDAAEVLFIKKDFDSVSVRELAAAADVNVAAVNYHFQGKENLYREVVLRRFVKHRNITLQALEKVISDADGSPRLEHVIASLVEQHLVGGICAPNESPFIGFMTREMASGHNQLQSDFVKQMIAPVFSGFSKAIVAAKPNLKQEDVTWIIASTIGQIHYYLFRYQKFRRFDPESDAAAAMLAAFPALAYEPEEYVKQVTDYITRFCTAALNSLYPEVD
jgi:AcrR family transcriptional regulator